MHMVLELFVESPFRGWIEGDIFHFRIFIGPFDLDIILI